MMTAVTKRVVIMMLEVKILMMMMRIMSWHWP